MRLLKIVIVGAMSLVMIMPITQVSFANNWTDESFSVPYYGDGSDMTIKARSKKDNTYTYVRLDSGASFGFACQAKKGVKAGDLPAGNTYDYSSSWHTLKAGKRDYFKNECRKHNLTVTYLAISSTDHKSHTYKGAWSPDNISGYGNA